MSALDPQHLEPLSVPSTLDELETNHIRPMLARQAGRAPGSRERKRAKRRRRSKIATASRRRNR